MLSPTAKFGYIPGLDGLRAISVLVVMAAHFGLSQIIPGGFGVTVFFFISGFLITRLLIAETMTRGRISLGNFYLRRLVRLYPALMFMILGSSALFLLFHFGGPTISEFIAGSLYGINFLLVLKEYGVGATYMSWDPLWSLAVEEHFYLVFPAFLLLMRGNWVRTRTIMGAVLLAVLAWRLVIVHVTNLPAETWTYVMTDARIDSIAWGCFLAILLHTRPQVTASRWLVGWLPVILGCVILLFTFLYREPDFRETLRYSLQGAALLVLLTNLYFFRPLAFAFPILEWPVLSWIGRVSYPLYLWHFVVLDFLQRAFGPHAYMLPLALAGSFTMAAISYYFVEQPFLTLRKRFGAHIARPSETGKSVPGISA